MDDRAPAPFGSPPAAVSYGGGYGSPTPYGGPSYGRATTDSAPATSTPPAMAQDLLDAKRAHERGTWLYVVGWVLIGVSIPVLAISIGLIAQAAGNISGAAQEAFVTALGLLAAGISIRGAGFALMMKADFLIRGHAWLGTRP